MERLSEFTNKIKDTEIYNYIMKFSSTPVGMYIMWIVLHYLAANLYNMHCAPSGVVGFAISPLMASTPYCSGLLWILQNSTVKFLAIWTIIGSWIKQKLNERTNIDVIHDKND